jgi:hypothetical protein
VTVESVAAAFVTVAHLRVVDGGDAVLADTLLQSRPLIPAFHVLPEELPQELGGLYDLLPMEALLGQLSLDLPSQLQQTVRIGYNSS